MPRIVHEAQQPEAICLQELAHIFPKLVHKLTRTIGKATGLELATPNIEEHRSSSDMFATLWTAEPAKATYSERLSSISIPNLPSYPTPHSTQSPSSSSLTVSSALPPASADLNQSYATLASTAQPTQMPELMFDQQRQHPQPQQSSGPLTSWPYQSQDRELNTNQPLAHEQLLGQNQVQEQSQGYSLPFQALMSLSEDMFQQGGTAPLETSKLFDSATWSVIAWDLRE